MKSAVDEPVDAVEKVLGEVPVPPYVTQQHVQLAMRAVLQHGPESWPTGDLCRSDLTPYPCRLHRWGRAVLRTRGMTDRAVEDLIARAQQPARVPDGRR
ncbi:hypothetical protein ACFY2R_25870 [Micromonospora olivasterospora]|uniref:Uncharacterized protein n=1 Tax=Micromonospora olivasterospora TaxID=1880 RepID=A0A562I585_MICOL|nr:hypothetical protein [Micromonospora olivasterospora]TWH66171.1 hypothetical protein JD77_01122 [Micromonospora olivasterospora]